VSGCSCWGVKPNRFHMAFVGFSRGCLPGWIRIERSAMQDKRHWPCASLNVFPHTGQLPHILPYATASWSTREIESALVRIAVRAGATSFKPSNMSYSHGRLVAQIEFRDLKAINCHLP